VRVISETDAARKAIDPTWASDAERGDIAIARRIVQQHGQDILWCEDIGWLVYDGRRWAVDKKQVVIDRGQQTIRRLYREVYEENDPTRAKVLAKLALSHSKAERIVGALKLVKPYVAITVEDLDRDPFALNVANGTIDLRTGKIRKHDRRDYITKLTPTKYSESAKAERFELFLSQIFNEKAELVSYIKRCVGYSATGDQREQCLFFTTGLGDNGKSTLMDTIREALGEYAQQAPSDVLMLRRGEHVPTERARLRGSRFVAISETDETQRLNEGQVKQLTGSEKIVARFMRQDFIEFDPSHHLWLATNHKPIITGTDHAIWRRIKIIPFDVKFEAATNENLKPEHLKDTSLRDQLRKELPGILTWIVAGAREWWNGEKPSLREPVLVTKAVLDYRDEQDVLKGFLDETTEQSVGRGETKALLYLGYVAWAKLAGLRPWPKPRFGKRLKERGLKESRDGVAREWLDVELTDEWRTRAQATIDKVDRRNERPEV
jgi:putative DNA primase/helicase